MIIKHRYLNSYWVSFVFPFCLTVWIYSRYLKDHQIDFIYYFGTIIIALLAIKNFLAHGYPNELKSVTLCMLFLVVWELIFTEIIHSTNLETMVIWIIQFLLAIPFVIFIWFAYLNYKEIRPPLHFVALLLVVYLLARVLWESILLGWSNYWAPYFYGQTILFFVVTFGVQLFLLLKRNILPYFILGFYPFFFRWFLQIPNQIGFPEPNIVIPVVIFCTFWLVFPIMMINARKKETTFSRIVLVAIICIAFVVVYFLYLSELPAWDSPGLLRIVRYTFDISWPIFCAQALIVAAKKLPETDGGYSILLGK